MRFILISIIFRERRSFEKLSVDGFVSNPEFLGKCINGSYLPLNTEFREITVICLVSNLQFRGIAINNLYLP